MGRVDEHARRVDRAIANHIMKLLATSKEAYKSYIRTSIVNHHHHRHSLSRLSSSLRSSHIDSIAELSPHHRRPKFILFARNHNYLQAVAHFLYMGNSYNYYIAMITTTTTPIIAHGSSLLLMHVHI
jgi:hypothetical protein